jgi:putative DNA primase/helicase
MSDDSDHDRPRWREVRDDEVLRPGTLPVEVGGKRLVCDPLDLEPKDADDAGAESVAAVPDAVEAADAATPTPDAPDTDAQTESGPGAETGSDSADAIAADLRETAVRLVRLPKLDRELQQKVERGRLHVTVAVMKAAIEEALEAEQEARWKAAAEATAAAPVFTTRDEPEETNEARLDRLITELLPLKGLPLNQAVKALAAEEKINASDIVKALQARRAAETQPSSPPPSGLVQYPHGYSMTDRGLVYQPPPGADGVAPHAEKITATQFELLGETCDEGGGEFGLLLRWQDTNHLQHQWAMPQAHVHADGNTIASELQRYGLKCSPTRSAHERLKMFLAEVRVNRHILCVANSGWHDTTQGMTFVLLDGTVFGGDGVVLQTQRVARGSAFTLRGTLDEWNHQVGRLAVGNDRMGLCICTALASPLLHIMNEPSGGIHLVGPSKIAKSAISRAGTSVWGRADAKGLERSWRNTTNGLEGAAAESTGILLTLEEFGMANPYEASDGIYMLANESGKTRAARDGTARLRQAWAMFFLSTGEITLQQKMAEAGKRPSAGLLVRFANVPADAGCGLGVFQNLHGMTGVEAFGRHLHEVTTTQQYGTAGRAWLEHLVADYRSDPDLLRRALSALRDRFLAAQQGLTGADTQVRSVASRFAVLAAAGELATRYGVLAWPGGEALRAVGASFQTWLTDRGSIGPGDDAAAVLQVRHFIEAHGDSRFSQILPEDANAPERLSDRPTPNRVGFRKLVGDEWEYWILPESWGATVCKGLSISPAAAAEALRVQGLLVDSTERYKAGRVVVPGVGRLRAYRVSSSILDG